MEWIDIHQEDDLNNVELTKEQEILIRMASVICDTNKDKFKFIIQEANYDPIKTMELMGKLNRISKIAEYLQYKIDYNSVEDLEKISFPIIMTLIIPDDTFENEED